MEEQATYFPTIKVIHLWTSNKVSILVEHRPEIEKIRMAVVPTDQGGPAVDYYMDIPIARVIFRSLMTGQLEGPAARQNKNGAQEAYHGFTKTEANTRQIFIQNKDDGIGINISKDNGEKLKNSVYPNAFQVQVIAHAVDAYITRLDMGGQHGHPSV